MFENLLRDIRYALRALAKSPTFAAVSALTLAVGIGANTAIFSVVSAVLLNPLPYSEPERIVMVWNRWKSWDKTWLSLPEYLDYREQCRSFSDVAIWTTANVNLTGEGEPERVTAGVVSASLFRVLGVDAAVGRVFDETEDTPGRDQIAVLSYGLWQRRYGGEPTLIGSPIDVDGQSRIVLGIMPAGFKLPLDYQSDGPSELWLPIAIDPASVDRRDRGNHSWYSTARLTADSTVDEANAELDLLTRRFTEEGLYHGEMQFETFALLVTEEVMGGVRPALLLLFGMVGVLLLIACANAANLLLTRSESRQRELAVRTALGAGRRRLLGQLLTESLILSSIGGVLGLALAYAGARLLVTWNPASIPRVAEVAVSLPVLSFTLAVSLATGLLFGLAPALQVSRLELTASLKEGGLAAMAGSRRQRFRNSVVVAEIALAVVLVLCAGLMVRSFWEILNIDPGFRSGSVLTLRLSLPQETYPEPQDVVRFYRELQARIEALPGVNEAGAVRGLPLSGVIGDWSILIEGRPPVPGNNPKGDWQVVSPGYFEAMGMELVRGRFFDSGDRSDAREVALINETMARKYWPDEDPIGQRFQMGTRGGRPWITIVGIVGDVVHNGITTVVKEKFYRPHAQLHHSTRFSPRSMTFVIQTSSEPMGLVSSVRREIRAMDANLPISEIRTLDDVLKDAVSGPRFTTLLLGLFAAAALLLAAVGIYGVITYSVSQRTHEIGIRMALGAGRGRVLAMILGQGVGLTLVGSALGVGLALWLTRWMASFLYGVGTTDLATFVAVPSALFMVALVASYIPSLRATHVHPVTALRME